MKSNLASIDLTRRQRNTFYQLYAAEADSWEFHALIQDIDTRVTREDFDAAWGDAGILMVEDPRVALSRFMYLVNELRSKYDISPGERQL
jgi:hypothetical protein